MTVSLGPRTVQAAFLTRGDFIPEHKLQSSQVTALCRCKAHEYDIPRTLSSIIIRSILGGPILALSPYLCPHCTTK